MTFKKKQIDNWNEKMLKLRRSQLQEPNTNLPKNQSQTTQDQN